ncbi:MAG: hypothetical protein Q9181_006094 [Wetmoreana brouardii]
MHWVDQLPWTDWTPIKIYEAHTRIANAVIGRVFFGSGICRDKDLLKITFEGEVDFYEVAYAIARWPLLLRPLAAKILPRARALKQNYQAMTQLLRPVLEERLRLWPAEPKGEAKGRPNDFMQWMLDTTQTQPCSLERQCQLLLDIATDAAFATNVSLTHISFDLATHPEYVQPLREEFADIIARPGEITRASMARMAKLDSVMKESHRMNPQAVVSIERNVTAPILLSSGITLPPGLRIAFPTPQQGLDPQIWPNPTDYDGLRFFKLRQQSAASQHDYQYSNSRPDFMLFGKGLHICPARILMSNVLKLALTHILDEYDLKLADTATGRPKNSTMGNVLYPNREVEILVKRRSGK